MRPHGKTRGLRQQRGATLVIALIFLVLMSLFAISQFNTSTGNMRIVGNMQSRQEAISAAQQAIEQTLSSSAFTTNPDAVAASPVPVDINGDGVSDYAVQLTPRPSCYRAKAIKTSELDPAIAADIACIRSGVVQNAGLDTAGAGAAAGDSLCAESEWNVRAQVVDERTGTRVAVHQGVSLRVLATDALNSCL